MTIAVVTVCSDPAHPGLARLKRSCDRHGWPLHVVVRDWFPLGFWTKPAGVRDALPGLKAKGFRWVLFTDAYDTVALGPPSELDPHLTGGCLFSADKAPWPPVPKDRLENKYPPRPPGHHGWWFVNSGGYLADIDFLGDYVLAGDPPLGDEWTGGGQHTVHRCDDQLWMASKYLTCPKRDTEAGCRIDRECVVFQTTGHTNAPDWGPEYARGATFEVRGGRVFNKKTGTTPLWLHGNGHDDMTWFPGGES